MIEELIRKKNCLIELNPKQERNMEVLSKYVNVPVPILEVWHSWYNVDGNWYYFKPYESIYFLFNELIGEQLARYFCVDTVHYELAFCKKKNNPYLRSFDKYSYGVLSKNFRQKNKRYLSSIDLHIPGDSKHISNLKSKKVKRLFSDEENYNMVIEKIIKMTILDFYMNQWDRRACNFCFSKDKNNFIDLCKLYDYENSFSYVSNIYENSILQFNLNNQGTLNYIKNNEVMQQQLYRLLDLNIIEIMDEIIDYYNIIMPKDVKDIYLDNDKRMKTMVKEYKLIK